MERIPVFYSDEFLENYDTVDCEDPARIASIYTKIGDIAEFIEPNPCSRDDLLLCHSERLVSTVERDPVLYTVAMKAAGGAINAAEMSFEKPSFALIRPPGHHAGRNFNGGFCFFNNMAIAVSGLFRRGSIESALIVDIDLHYGNGTYDIFGDDSRVHFKNISASTQYDFYRQLEDALIDAGQADIVGCSVGFDTYIKDWGALLFTDDYRKIGAMITASHHRCFAILEGGYYLPDLGENARSFLTGMREGCS